MITRRSLLLAAAATTGVLAPMHAVRASVYPQRSVKIVVAGLPGVPFDLLARAVADKLSTRFGQNFIVDNRPGAAGNLGAEAVARSPADGYTVLVALSTTFTVNPSLYRNLPFDPADFRFLTLGASSANYLVVHPSIPVNSVAEFVAYANKEAITYAHGGPGTPGHLCMEYFGLLAGFKAVPVAYRGNTQLSTDLVAGQIKFGFVGGGGVIQHIRAGGLKGLAVSSRQRSLLLPNLPTIAELGYPQFVFEANFPLAVRAGTPEPVAAELEGAVRAALIAPDAQARFRPLDLLILATTGAEAKERIEADRKLWAGIVKQTGMRVD
jgi:tripartite-type tricarboxylate transporter receptor subunit TctC